MRKLGLSFVKLLLRLFGCGDINQRPNELQLVRLIPNCMSSNVDMFDCAIRHQQSMFKIKILPVSGRAIDCRLHESEIFRMGALKDHFDSDGGRPVVSINSGAFLRPEDFSARYIPSEAAGSAQSLRFSQIDLASP